MTTVGNKSSHFDFWIFLLFVAALSSTVFGPVCHYIGLLTALFFVLYKRIKYNVPLTPKLTKNGKLIFIILSLFFLYSSFSYLINYENFPSWARDSSVPFEMLAGTWLVSLLINDDKKRDIFVKTFFYINMIAGLWIVAEQIGIAKFPSPTFSNHNMLGPYLYLAIPLNFIYIIQQKMNSFLRSLYIAINIIFVIFSFSSITYAACSLEIFIILFFAYRAKILDVKLIPCFCIISLGSLFLLNLLTGNKITPLLMREMKQISSGDIKTLTTKRDEIWIAALYYIKQRPFFGWGINKFAAVHKEFLETFADTLKLTSRRVFVHVHNVYLMIAFEVGIPGMLIFLGAMLLPIWDSFKRLFFSSNKGDVWAIAFFSMFLGQLIYSLAGEMVHHMRADVAVLLWVYWGIFSVYQESAKTQSLA